MANASSEDGKGHRIALSTAGIREATLTNLAGEKESYSITNITKLEVRVEVVQMKTTDMTAHDKERHGIANPKPIVRTYYFSSTTTGTLSVWSFSSQSFEGTLTLDYTRGKVIESFVNWIVPVNAWIKTSSMILDFEQPDYALAFCRQIKGYIGDRVQPDCFPCEKLRRLDDNITPAENDIDYFKKFDMKVTEQWENGKEDRRITGGLPSFFKDPNSLKDVRKCVTSFLKKLLFRQERCAEHGEQPAFHDDFCTVMQSCYQNDLDLTETIEKMPTELGNDANSLLPLLTFPFSVPHPMLLASPFRRPWICEPPEIINLDLNIPRQKFPDSQQFEVSNMFPKNAEPRLPDGHALGLPSSGSFELLLCYLEVPIGTQCSENISFRERVLPAPKGFFLSDAYSAFETTCVDLGFPSRRAKKRAVVALTEKAEIGNYMARWARIVFVDDVQWKTEINTIRRNFWALVIKELPPEGVPSPLSRAAESALRTSLQRKRQHSTQSLPLEDATKRIDLEAPAPELVSHRTANSDSRRKLPNTALPEIEVSRGSMPEASTFQQLGFSVSPVNRAGIPSTSKWYRKGGVAHYDGQCTNEGPSTVIDLTAEGPNLQYQRSSSTEQETLFNHPVLQLQPSSMRTVQLAQGGANAGWSPDNYLAHTERQTTIPIPPPALTGPSSVLQSQHPQFHQSGYTNPFLTGLGPSNIYGWGPSDHQRFSSMEGMVSSNERRSVVPTASYQPTPQPFQPPIYQEFPGIRSNTVSQASIGQPIDNPGPSNTFSFSTAEGNYLSDEEEPTLWSCNSSPK